MKVLAFAWSQDEKKQWTRYLVRETDKGETHVTRLWYVDSEYFTCLHCLSQDVALVVELEQPTIRCKLCNQYSEIELDLVGVPPMEGDSDGIDQ